MEQSGFWVQLYWVLISNENSHPRYIGDDFEVVIICREVFIYGNNISIKYILLANTNIKS